MEERKNTKKKERIMPSLVATMSALARIMCSAHTTFAPKVLCRGCGSDWWAARPESSAGLSYSEYRGSWTAMTSLHFWEKLLSRSAIIAFKQSLRVLTPHQNQTYQPKVFIVFRYFQFLLIRGPDVTVTLVYQLQG